MEEKITAAPVPVRPVPSPDKTGEEIKPKPARPAVAPIAKRPAKPKKPGSNGVGMAITATVIIVLGLAALATYAFLKTQN